MITDQMNQTITLKDGQALGFAEYGNPEDKAVFHFHGSASSRFERPLDESMLVELGIRYISTDRPGHGLSDPQLGRKLLDWPDDISQLADHLDIDKFYILGLSAGGAYALACASKLPERVLAGAVVSSGAPPDRPNPYEGLSSQHRMFMLAARYIRPFIYLARRQAFTAVKDGIDDNCVVGSLPPHDQKLAKRPENRKMLVETVEEGYRQGYKAIGQDDILVFNPWGLRLEEIVVRMDIWHGSLDQNVPLSHAHFLHTAIPNCRLTIWPNQGHLAILDHWSEVLTALIA